MAAAPMTWDVIKGKSCAVLQVKDLITPHGALKSFNLVMDKHSGKSKVRGCVLLQYTPGRVLCLCKPQSFLRPCNSALSLHRKIGTTCARHQLLRQHFAEH